MQGVTCGVSCDINVRPTVISRPGGYWTKVQPWLRVIGQRGGIVKASDADIEFWRRARVGRRDEGGDPVAVAAEWVEQYGLGLAVITLGPGGGAAVEPGGQLTRVPGFPTKVVDTVGAGDTFMAGFLDGRVKLGLDLEGLAAPGRRGRIDRLLPARCSAADVSRGRRVDRRRSD